MWLRKLYAASVAAACHFTLNFKTEVWRILGIDASNEREVTGSIFCTRTTLCCRVFILSCVKELKTATPARSFADTRQQIQKDIGWVYPSYTGNQPAYLTTGMRESPFSNSFNARPSLFDGSSTSSLEGFCRACATLLIGKCGNESPLNFRSGLSLQFSLVTEYIRIRLHRA